MLTVIVCLVGSGKRSTRNPFPRRYSVIPSTEVTRAGFAGDFVSGAGAAAARETANAARMREDKPVLNDFMRRILTPETPASSRADMERPDPRWCRPAEPCLRRDRRRYDSGPRARIPL